MADNDTKKTIRFLSYHRPGVQAGKYSIMPSLKFDRDLEVLGHDFSIHETFKGNKLAIEVRSARFQLNPKDIHAVFPPRNSTGEFDNVLPHIELNQSTLPWERASGHNNRQTHWLGLLLLQEDEIDSENVELQRMPWTKLRDSLRLEPETSDEPADPKKPFPDINVLQVDQSFLQTILPTATDLQWLTHVRKGQDQHGNSFERAVLICNRMPKPGSRAEVHLVSFEQAFTSEGTFNDTKHTNQASGKIQLLSLLSWHFTCPQSNEYKVSNKAIARLPGEDWVNQVKRAFHSEEEKDMLYRGDSNFINAVNDKISSPQLDDGQLKKLLKACHIQTETFKGLMNALDTGWWRITSSSDNGRQFFESGSLPMAHGLRGGGKTVSWYRGPFVTSKLLSDSLEFELPIRNSDSLLLYDGQNNMLDTSYAAAWELGRLLTLNEPRICQQIAQWKTSHAREAAVVEQREIFDHLPFQNPDFAHKEDGIIYQTLYNYFQDLSLLRSVPFQYLVPSEQFLPHESLRFFHIDALWVECLLDGAFSIGRHTHIDVLREKDAAKPHPKRVDRMGLLLRSDLVSGWPSMRVEGYHGDPNTSKPLDILRFDRIGPNVLLIIFNGIINTVDIHLPPESLHFGFIRPTGENGQFHKELKDTDGDETGKTQEVEFEAKRVFKPKKFANNIGLQDTHTPSGQLAVELLEGVPRLRVSL